MAAARSAPEPVIRPFEAADVDGVMEIEELSFRTPWTRASFLQERATTWSRVDVLCEDGRVVAFCNYWLVADEVQILNIATHPQARRRGHAARLLRHVVEQAGRACFRLVTLEVRVSNLGAQALYRGFGFTPIGRRARYYEDNDEDAVVMTLELQDVS